MIAAGALGTLVFFAALISWLNPRLTRYVESEAFRREMEMETAKGLHLESTRFAPIRRTGFFGLQSKEASGSNGRKALTNLQARGVFARFNPWGIFLRRWQLDLLEIDSGEVGIQTYEPKPEPSPAKPWYVLFLPGRVYLKRVDSEPVDVTWNFLEEKSGIFATHLLITPNGRDFEYRANGGVFRLALVPDLELEGTHLYINHDVLKVYRLDLISRARNADAIGTIHLRGEARLKDSRSIEAESEFDRLPLSRWVPKSWQGHVLGKASGKVRYTSQSPAAQTSSGEATLRVEAGRIEGLALLDKLAAISGKPALRTLSLGECSLAIEWRYPQIHLRRLVLEDEEKLRVEGEITVEDQSLAGTIQLGVARPYLEWLPHPEEIFRRDEQGYLWTTVHLSGTLRDPKQDLSPRIAEALKESPGAALGIFFRGVADWFRRAFGD